MKTQGMAARGAPGLAHADSLGVCVVSAGHIPAEPLLMQFILIRDLQEQVAAQVLQAHPGRGVSLASWGFPALKATM